MSETKNLRLFKHNEPLETNENKFDIDLALNQNWDKLDEFAGMVNNKVIELEDKNEEQDFNLQEQNTKLEEQIKKDRENMINLEVEGQSIHIEDSSDLEGKLEVFGNVEQKAVKGIQLLERTNKGVTGWLFVTNPAGKGIIKEVNYLGTKAAEFSVLEALSSWRYMLRNVNLSKLKNNTTYTIQFDCLTNYDEKDLEINIVEGDGTNNFISFPRVQVNNTKKRIKVVATSNNTPLKSQILYIYPHNIGAISNTLTITNLILVEGDYSNKDLEWEEYTNLEGMPSINYPSEIRAVGDKGSVGIKKQNKNIAPKLKEGKLEKQNTFICNCKKGESFTLSFRGTTTTTDSRLFLRTNTEFTERTDSFIEQEEITLNGTEQKITITSTIDGILYIRTGSGPQIYNFEYLQIEKGKVATEYAEHQEQTKILPIQKPMLEGDDFINEADGWKERHKWKKIILNGQENTWQLYENGTRRFGLDLTKDLPLKETGKYAQGYCTHFEVATTMNINLTMFLQVEIGHFYIGIVDKNSKWADVNALKSELQRLYNAGTPVILYYKVETPTKLNCTPEQTKVLDELDNFPTYKPVTNITTDSIAKIKLKYIADTKTYVDNAVNNKVNNLEQQVSVISELLSTTKTSSILLDNLQKDIESEVL